MTVVLSQPVWLRNYYSAGISGDRTVRAVGIVLDLVHCL